MHSERLLAAYNDTFQRLKQIIPPIGETHHEQDQAIDTLFTILDEVNVICEWAVYRDTYDWLLFRDRLRLYCSIIRRSINKNK